MLRSSLLVFAATLVAAQANAATVTQTVAFGPTPTDFRTSTLSVAPFNAALGTLTGVTLNLGANATLSGSVQNISSTPQSFTVSTNTLVTLASTSGTSINGLSVSLDATQSYANVDTGSTVVFGPFTPSGSKQIAGTPLSAFTAGPITLTASTKSFGVISGGGNNVITSLKSTAAGALTVTYTYDSLTPGQQPATVPEPASLMLLGAGLVGAGLIRRKAR